MQEVFLSLNFTESSAERMRSGSQAVCALVLFSIGGIAATVGTPSVLVWTLSVIFGFL